MRIVQQSATIITSINGSEMLQRIEAAGRTCYRSEDRATPGSAEKFAAMIIKRGHLSVLEHESISVRFICDRGVSHEIVRHRLASYSQESTRYCNYGKAGEVTFIKPCFWQTDDPLRLERWAAWRRAMLSAEKEYLYLLEMGATPQEARSVLPNSLKTEIVMTANLREWRHFFSLRADKPAHPQMREVACPLLAEFRTRIPVVFDDVGDPGCAG